MIEAEFLGRPNRFVALCRLRGEEAPVRVHVPNTGRLRELLVPGTEALLRPNPAGGKTAYTLCTVRHQGRWVSIDSQLPNRVVAEALANRELSGFGGYTAVRREVRWGESRFDIALLGGAGEVVRYVEVKGVTLVEDGTARFPDAPTERGARHLRELGKIAADPALPAAAVVFLVQREDAERFSPNDRTDPGFAEALREAAAAGVLVRALRCAVEKEGVRILGEIPACL